MILNKILKEISDINRYVATMTSDIFYTDDRTQKAVAMSLINIGELSKAFSAEFIANDKTVPWKDIQSMRNIAAHDYESFDMQIVWKTIQDDLPVLREVMEASQRRCK